MIRRRRVAFRIGIALVVVLGFTTTVTRAGATIDGVSPGSLTVTAGDGGGAQVTVTSEAGSCLTAAANVAGIEVGVNPGCAAAGTPVFSLTVIVDASVPAGDYRVDIREFDAARDQLLDTSELAVQVEGGTTTTTTTTAATTTTTAAPTTTTSTTAAPTTTTTSSSTPTTTSTSTTAVPAPGTTLPAVTTAPSTTLPPTTSTTVGESTTTTTAEVAVRPSVETGLSPWLTAIAVGLLAVLAWLIVRAQGDQARVRYRSLVAPDRLARLHQTFRDAGQGAPAAIRAAAASSGRLDAGIRPLSGPSAPVDVEVVVGAPWSRRRARVVAARSDGAMRLMVQRGEAGLADVPGSEESAESWLAGLAEDLEGYGDGRGAAAIRRWLGR